MASLMFYQTFRNETIWILNKPWRRISKEGIFTHLTELILKTWKRIYEKWEWQAHLTHENGYRTPKQNIIKQNPAICKWET